MVVWLEICGSCKPATILLAPLPRWSDKAFAAVDGERQFPLREAKGLAGCGDCSAQFGCIFDHAILTEREDQQPLSII